MNAFANLSLDLDNKWAYLRTANRPEWKEFPSYLPLVCPLIVESLSEFDIRMTTFVVGRDLEFESSLEAIELLVRAGHELGNHSYHHEPWLHLYDAEKAEYEIDRTDELLNQLGGVHSRGFRGPGFSDSRIFHEKLAERGYRFMASQFSSCLGPIARAFYFAKTGLRGRQIEGREKLFGGFSTVLGKNSPYRLPIGSPAMWMVPVTVMPLFRTPFHFSYLLYLSEKSERIAQYYFCLALWLCRTLEVEPSLLLHPLDFLGGDEVEGLEFFPGMKQSGSVKRQRLRWFLAKLTERFQVVPMGRAVARFDGHVPAPSVKCELEDQETLAIDSHDFGKRGKTSQPQVVRR